MKRVVAALAVAGLLAVSLTACVQSGRTDQSRGGGESPASS
ncbi:hypothetical protein ABZ412_06070 [Nocardia sp. NPDC005746]